MPRPEAQALLTLGSRGDLDFFKEILRVNTAQAAIAEIVPGLMRFAGISIRSRRVGSRLITHTCRSEV